MIVGRGWGQGPTHSQSLQAWLAHTPGLKVVMPSTTEDAKGLLLSSIFDDNPVVFIEHRWLHNQYGEVPKDSIKIPLGKKLEKSETEKKLLAVSMSLMTMEAIRAADELKQNISCDLIDLRTVAPIDWFEIFESVKKTGRLLVFRYWFKNWFYIWRNNFSRFHKSL